MTAADPESPLDAQTSATLAGLSLLLSLTGTPPGACIAVLGDSPLLTRNRGASKDEWTATILRLIVQGLVARQALTFLCTSDAGDSLQAASLVAKEDVDLILAEPYPRRSAAADHGSPPILDRLHRRADHIEYTGLGRGDSLATHRAHDWMLRHCRLLVLVWDGNKHSHLFACYKLAKRRNVPVLIVNPRDRTVESITW